MNLIFLWPLSWIYRGVCFLRRKLYELTRSRTAVPVIVIGNISLGGTGKTPLLIAIAQHLTAQGRRVGIVSRGYKGKGPFPCFIQQESPEIVGDEPFLIAQKTHCPVVVDPSRVRAIQTLLRQTSVDVILSDDGLQHYAMDRTLEIAVVDGLKGFGNGLCLPAGLLREPVFRLKEVDAVVINQTGGQSPFLLGISVKKQFFMKAVPDRLISLQASGEIDFSRLKVVHVVTGIGHPERFLETLKLFWQEKGEASPKWVTHFLPDHHAFSLKDFTWMAEDDFVVMTEKDAVKVQRLGFSTDQLKQMSVLSIRVDIDPAFFELFDF